MKAVKWYSPRDLRFVDVEKPKPTPYQALIRVESVGICGSDLHYYLEGRIGSTVITEPLILGHEFAGLVAEVGAKADRILIGKRVAVEPSIPCQKCESCRSGHYSVCRDLFFPGVPPYDGVLCEYVAMHAEFCFPVPDLISAPEAALIEPAAVAIHTVELGHVKPGETAAILGLGPIGLLTAQVAKLSGIHTLFGTDLLDYRVEAGRKFGVDVAFNASKHDTVQMILEQTGGRGVDIAFDTARSSETPGLACEIVRPAGRCVFTGISGNEYDPLPVNVARRKELTVRWCRRFLHTYPRTIALVAARKIDVVSLLTHTFPLERTREAFELVAAAADHVLKVSIDL
jgi:L-iditol 2-dehydrogenase